MNSTTTPPKPGKLHDGKKAFQIRAIRIGEPSPALEINSCQDVLSFWRETVATRDWFDPEKEHMVALSLSKRNTIKSWHLVSIGTVDECPAHPREIFRPAILAAAAGIVLVHNHPSGCLTPSKPDIGLTHLVYSAAQAIRIDLIDHVIVSWEGHRSIRGFLGDEWGNPPRPGWIPMPPDRRKPRARAMEQIEPRPLNL